MWGWCPQYGCLKPIRSIAAVSAAPRTEFERRHQERSQPFPDFRKSATLAAFSARCDADCGIRAPHQRHPGPARGRGGKPRQMLFTKVRTNGLTARFFGT